MNLCIGLAVRLMQERTRGRHEGMPQPPHSAEPGEILVPPPPPPGSPGSLEMPAAEPPLLAGEETYARPLSVCFNHLGVAFSLVSSACAMRATQACLLIEQQSRVHMSNAHEVKKTICYVNRFCWLHVEQYMMLAQQQLDICS